MNRSLVATMFALAILSSSLLSPALAQSPSRATIVQLTGTVDVRPAGSQLFKRATPGMRLSPGDLVRSGPGTGTSASLLVNGQPVSLGPGERYRIPATTRGRSDSGSGPSWIRRKLESLQNNDEMLSHPGAAPFRALKLVNGVDLISPVNTMVTQPRPTFTWKVPAPAPARGYELRVKKNGKVIWELPTRDSRAQYAAGAPPLIPGETYFWTVAVVGESEADLAEAYLQVATARQSDQLRDRESAVTSQTAHDPAYREFSLGAAAEADGFLDRARENYRKACAIAPSSSLYRKALRDLDLALR